MKQKNILWLWIESVIKPYLKIVQPICMTGLTMNNRYSIVSVKELANFWGCERLWPNFPKLARKIFGPLFVWIFSHGEHFWGDPQTKISVHLILNTLGATFARFFSVFTQILMIMRRFLQILPRFPRILPGFSPNQNFGVALAPPSPTPLYYCSGLGSP